MPPRSVSPPIVYVLSIPVFLLLLVPIALAELRLFGHDLGGVALPGISVVCWLSAQLFLVPLGLRCFGIRVRSQSVERLQPDDRGGVKTSTGAPPVRITRHKMSLRVGGATLLVVGLLGLMPAKVFESGHSMNPWTKTFGDFRVSMLLAAAGVLLLRFQPYLLCEINDRGIRAPHDIAGWITFIPWSQVSRCEIIRDDRSWWDHFIVWDQVELPLFKQSRIWMREIPRSDRERLFAALRSRLPGKDKPLHAADPAMAGTSASPVWDRELDG
jgi:hypothetical protein